MNLKRLKQLLLVFLLSIAAIANAQDRFTVIQNKLTDLSKDTPGLNDKVELSVNDVSIQEFIHGLATTNNLNVSVDGALTTKINNNFSNVTVSDVLLFLCKKYDLDMAFIGNIMSITQYTAPKEAPAKYTSKPLKITYDKAGDLLTLDLSNDSLALVAKELTKVSQKNVVFAPDLPGKMVSGYIQAMPFNGAMDKFAFANDLKVTATNDNFYLIEKSDNAKNNGKPGTTPGISSSGNSSGQGIIFKADANKLITVDAQNNLISDILSTVSKQLKMSYFLFTEPKGSTSLNITNATYDDFLNYLFNGTDYTFRKQGDIYLIGDRNIEGLRETKVIALKYRTVEKMIDYIPADLKKGVDIKIFTDQNSLILSGSQPRIAEIENFLRDVDRVVPVISIEVMIVDINNSRTVSTGIKAGLGSKPTTTGGDISPGVTMNLGANSLNNIIDGINGFGAVNLGHVTSSFYVNLKLLETNGNLTINSTPLLSTLNGNEAKMSIGETRYYEEDNTNVIANSSTTTTTTRVFKPLNAEFSMTINPIVSGDEQITMSITVKKSSFTGQSSGTGSPYNTTTRDFQSLIRVKNQEMIMLGGLDESSLNETSSGLPLLSRIPILKWFFSSRDKTKSKSKLTIFIKPTVIY